MPLMDAPASVLWSLPLLLILTIPTAHRVLLSKFADRYTFGNWFRASFLYTFTWLAVCFILVNPPLADISPPEVAEKTIFIDLETGWNQSVGDFTASDNVTQRTLGLAFAVRDNFDVSNVNVNVVIEWTGDNTVSYSGSVDSMRGEWDNYASPGVSKVMGRSTDVPILIELENFTISENQPYTLTITLTQNGDPWELEEVYTHRFIVNP
jgi:hypothetical protein